METIEYYNTVIYQPQRYISHKKLLFIPQLEYIGYDNMTGYTQQSGIMSHETTVYNTVQYPLGWFNSI